MSALYEHPGYQRLPRRRLRGAGQGRRAGRGDRGRAAQSAQALRRVSRRWPSSAVLASARRRAAATSTTSRCRAIPRRTCTRRSCSRSRSGRRSRSWSRTGSRTSPRCAAIDDDARRRRWASSRAPLRAKFHGVEHHKSHISSAFFISPFEEAACLSIDGFGDFVSTMRARRARSQARGPRSRSSSPTRPGCSTRRSRSSSASTGTARSGR